MPSARIAVLIGTELAAFVATIKVQSDAGASAEKQIGVAVGVTALLAFGWAVGKYIVGPLVRGWLWRTVREEEEHFDRAVFRTLDRNDDNRAIVRRYGERVFGDLIARNAETRDLVESNTDRLVFVEESNKRQGEALTRELARAMEHMARATDSQTRIMEKIQKELEDHSIIIARMDERISAWDGQERRRGPR